MVTVLLVRHADVANTAGAPLTEPLNDKGRERAKTLAHLAEALRVTAIFTSKAERTKETARPVGAQLGLVPKDVTPPASDIFSGAAGETVLVVGHSDTIPALVDELLEGSPMPTTPYPDPIPRLQFDNLFVVTVAGPGKAEMVHLKYGTPTP
jgi:2,3-bisphosphoglycerate-dependent phosphoglycerate mutase